MGKQTPTRTVLWWTSLIRGGVLVVVGLVMFLWPTRSVPLLLQLLGVYWLVGGVLDLFEGTIGLVKRDIGRGPRSRLLMLLSGVVSLAAGALLLGQPMLTGWLAGRFVIVLIGAAIAAVGAIRLWHGRYGTRSWRTVLVATTYAVLGVLMVAHPLAARELLLLLLSAWAVVAGLLSLVASVSRRRPK